MSVERNALNPNKQCASILMHQLLIYVGFPQLNLIKEPRYFARSPLIAMLLCRNAKVLSVAFMAQLIRRLALACCFARGTRFDSRCSDFLFPKILQNLYFYQAYFHFILPFTRSLARCRLRHLLGISQQSLNPNPIFYVEDMAATAQGLHPAFAFAVSLVGILTRVAT